MRKVQFNDDVRTVEYTVSKSKKSRKRDGHLRSKEDIERGKSSASVEESDGDVSSSGEQQESSTTSRRRDRRQSFAAQILMASAKWGQHKDYRQRKMSLHGKPIYYTAPSRRKHKLRKLMISVFNFLERPDARSFSAVYHISTFLLVCTSLIVTVFVTIDEHKEQSQRIMFVLEIILVVVFSIELFARVWSAGCRVRYQGFKGRLRFLKKPFCIIDLLVILSSFVIIVVGKNEESAFAATTMRGLRFLQVLRMVRVDRRGGTWKLLGSVVSAHSKELITAWYIGFLALIFASFLVYQVEKDVNEGEFKTFADALWWGLITLTTIGYGDKTPHTWAGRLIASCFAILGISFFALPAGILGSGFALKVQEQHRQKHVARRRTPAAFLIQCFWRCYAADADSTSLATWQPFLKGPQEKKTFRERFMGTHGNRVRVRGDGTPTSGFETNKDDFMKNAFGKLQRFGSTNRKYTEKRDTMESELENYDDDSSSYETISEFSEVQKNAIRGIRMLKFQVARRKFKEALRPYDVKDVIEQYSSGHIDMLARVKNLQSRVDSIVGIKSNVASPSLDFTRSNSVYRSARAISVNGNKGQLNPFEKEISMNDRLMNVESSVAAIERKMDRLLSSFEKRMECDAKRKSLPPNLNLNDEDRIGIEETDVPIDTQSDVPKRTRFLNLSSPRLKRRQNIAFSDAKFFSTESCKDILLFADDRNHQVGNNQQIEDNQDGVASEESGDREHETPLLVSCEDCSRSSLPSPSDMENFNIGDGTALPTAHFSDINRTFHSAIF